METSSLNKAHQQHRRAETHLKYKRFAEAIECHDRAAELLSEALQLTENPWSVESIKLQRSFHLRQKEIILIKKDQLENYMKAVENSKNKTRSEMSSEFKDTYNNINTNLQLQIYRNIEETDSLFELLKKGNGYSDCESLKSFSTTDTDDKLIDLADSTNCKHPKDATIVIEELKTLKDELHKMVYELVDQLDSKTREVEHLNLVLKQLELEKHKDIEKSPNNLKVVTNSSGGTSPFVFSPCSELSPDVHETSRVLPNLAPLDLPNFDFPNFVKNNVRNNN